LKHQDVSGSVRSFDDLASASSPLPDNKKGQVIPAPLVIGSLHFACLAKDVSHNH
jgi:hypothetical protein